MAPERNSRNEHPEENVQALSSVEPIRRRPGMYIGFTGADGLRQLLLELIFNSLAEIIAGHGRSVRVTFRTDGFVEVADDGRTPPNETIEREFTFIGTGYQPPLTGRNYFWYVVANALSERLRITTRSDSSRYQHTFSRGVTDAVLQTGGPPSDRGLTISFRPDPEIFGNAVFDRNAIRNRLRQLAYLHSGVRITLTDEVTDSHDEFEYADGIPEYIRSLNEGRQTLHSDVILLRGEDQGVRYEVGLQWCADGDETRMSFVNHHYTQNGGTHDKGLRDGAAAAVRELVRDFAPQSGELLGEDIRAGLTAVVSVWLAEPILESATRSGLGSPEVEGIVRVAVRRGVREYFEANHDAAKRVVDAVIAAQDMRVEAKATLKRLRQVKRGE